MLRLNNNGKSGKKSIPFFKPEKEIYTYNILMRTRKCPHKFFVQDNAGII